MASDSGPRSVRISDDERGGWSSDRPRREGGPQRPADISVRGRVLAPTDRLRYSPGSLLLILAAAQEDRDRFVQRAVEDRGAVLSLERVRSLLTGRVPEEQMEENARELLEAAILKRLTANESVVVAAGILDAEERDRLARLAAGLRRPRHLILIETGRDAVPEEDRAALNELRRVLDAGELGAEGFHSGLRLGGNSVAELKKIVFRPEPRDD
jgi:hypothetical protein